jgi:hypothetical protein
MAKPYLYFCGATPFNGELLEAVHLIIEDDIVKSDIGSRRNFGNKIKQVAANEGQVCHAKHKQALTLYPLWRISISCNNEPEHLTILPQMDPSLLDKVTILKAMKAPMPMPTRTDEERRALCETIEKELAHYLDYLIKMEIPAEMKCGRFMDQKVGSSTLSGCKWLIANDLREPRGSHESRSSCSFYAVS